ncbi:MAG: hypothetical protein ACJ8ER_05735 [Allosphingosinicella sp.]
MVLRRPDFTAAEVDWTAEEPDPKARIAPETFSFIRCRFRYRRSHYPGLLYYPHPETKPGTNAHHYDVLEVLSVPVAGLEPGAPASVVCRADALAER